MAERDVQAELENLKSELSKLRADISGVTAALKGTGAAEAASVKEQLKHALEEAKSMGKKSVEVVEHQVGEHPFITILAAFGIGFLVAKVMDRNKS